MNPEIESHQKISNAICMLLSHQPEVGFVLLQFDFAPSRDVPIMGIYLKENSMRIACVYNPNEIVKLTILEIVAVLQHEVAHVMQCHCQRRAGRDHELWNIACDMVVNGKKSNPRIGLRTFSRDFPAIPFADSLIWIPEWMCENQTAEGFYNELERLRDRKPSIISNKQITLDDHSMWELDATDDGNDSFPEMIASSLTKKQKHFIQASLSGETYTGDLKAEDVESDEVPWNFLLRRVLARTFNPLSRRTSYVRRNRRFPMLGVPGHQRLRKPILNIVLDVSGSIDMTTLGLFFSEIKRIDSKIRVNLLLWDTKFRGFFENFDASKWKSFSFRGGGGTDMVAPLCWLEENNHVRDLVVLFTDGYVFEWKKKSPWSLVTVIVGWQAGPDWGQTIHIQAENARGVK